MKTLLLALVVAYVQPPPARYDYAYTGKLKIIHGNVEKHCGRQTWGCAEEKNGRCVVVLSRIGARGNGQVLTPPAYRILLHHEIAHCNGWAGNHPA